MTELHPAARALIESNVVAHLVTLEADGSPQVTIVWAGLDGEDVVCGHLRRHRKLVNVERDPRVAVSWEAETVNHLGLTEYLVVSGTARIDEGGAPELLQRLAHVYLGPDVVFPGPDAPPGYVLRITPRRVTGVGPWA